MKVIDEAYLKCCNYCGKKVETPISYRGVVFCSASCKKSFISRKEKSKALMGLVSVRAFKPDRVSESALKNILETGRNTPSSHNIQPWHFIVVTDPEIKKKLAKGRAKFIETSALVIVGCGDPAESPKWYEIEVAIAMQSMVLEAWVQGIGSCWVDIEHNEKEIKEILTIPDSLKIVALVAFGYPAKMPKPAWKKPFDQIIHYNRF
jgi:nitroreductase